MADVKISALPVANDTDTLEYCGVQDSITKQVPGSAALAQTLRDLGYTPAPINSPTFTGDPKAPTPVTGDNDTSIATTAFVKAQNYVTATTAPVKSVFGRTGDVVQVSGDYSVGQVTGAAPIASPTFTGDPKAPTPAPGDSDTSIATTAFVSNAVSTAIAPLGNALLGTPNHQAGTSYTLAASDLNLVIECDNGSPFTLTVPLNATVSIPVGWFTYFTQYGAGQVTVTPGTGAVIIKNASSLTTRVQNSFLGLTKLATDTWILWGDMT